MKKSTWKLAYINPKFFKKTIYKNSTLHLSKYRSSTIFSKLIGHKVVIYNGAWPLTKLITEAMIGLKLGELSISKKYNHQGKKKRKKNKKK